MGGTEGSPRASSNLPSWSRVLLQAPLAALPMGTGLVPCLCHLPLMPRSLSLSLPPPSAQDTQKAKQFLPFLQRAGRSEAVVEYVFSGSRLKLYMPKETCLITFLLAGEWGTLAGWLAGWGEGCSQVGTGRQGPLGLLLAGPGVAAAAVSPCTLTCVRMH